MSRGSIYLICLIAKILEIFYSSPGLNISATSSIEIPRNITDESVQSFPILLSVISFINKLLFTKLQDLCFGRKTKYLVVFWGGGIER